MANLSILLLLPAVLAQVELPGRFFVMSFNELRVSGTASHQLPFLNNTELALKADSDNSETDGSKGSGHTKFAESVEYSLDINKDAEISDDLEFGVRRWKMLVSSADAQSLSLHFSQFHIPPQGEFYVVGKDRKHGAYVAGQSNMPDGRFSIALIGGDSAILQYIEPLNGTFMERPQIKLAKVVHAFRGGPRALGSAGTCNVDVACADGHRWANQINSAAVLLTNDGQRFCSGVMVNNVKQDGKQYFLTANHCIYTDSGYFMVGFNYQWSYCRSSNVPGSSIEPQIQFVQNAKVLAKWDQSDFALLLINERIPSDYGVYLSGWDQRPIASADVIGIHHPSGDVKKISFFTGLLTLASWNEAPHKYHWKISSWTRGVTEPGSSGSPLFNSNGLIIGLLHGGQSSCSNLGGYDMYGGFAFDWNSSLGRNHSLNAYLNPSKASFNHIEGMSLCVSRAKNSRMLKYARK